MRYEKTRRCPRQRINGADNKHTVNMKAAKQLVPRARDKIKLSHADEDRFWSKVDKSGGPNACWLWTASKNEKGYGQFRKRDWMFLAHRIAWTLKNGQIPLDGSYHGTCICHKCDVPACCNPSHLFSGSVKDNIDDMINKGRKVHLRGEYNGRAKLTPAQILEIRSAHAAGNTTYHKLASQYGVTFGLIGFIVSRRSWKHIMPSNDPLTGIW